MDCHAHWSILVLELQLVQHLHFLLIFDFVQPLATGR